MSDLISRAHFDDRVRTAVGMVEDELSKDFKDGVLSTLTLLASESPAEPERKKGKLLNANPVGECSVCGWLIDYRDGFNYCPHCGADMRGDKDERTD